MSPRKKRPLFTILVPVHRPPHLLPFALESIQAQTVKDFEVFVICDGAPSETTACAETFAAKDKRIRVFNFEKGQRLGEAHRDVALREADSTYVAQLADDDLWFPDYLAELQTLLGAVDFGNLIQANLLADDTIKIYPGQLSDTRVRNRMAKKRWNFFGPSFAGYRLAAYRQLPEGWSPAPEDIPTDLHMWRKFFAHEGLSYDTRFSVQGVKLGDNQRRDMTLEERKEEHGKIANSLKKAATRREFQARAMLALFTAQNGAMMRKINQIRATVSGANLPSPEPGDEG